MSYLSADDGGNAYLLAGRSANQPKLCPNATWDPDGITFANNITIGANPYGLFINSNNTVYAANNENGHILIWLEGSAGPTGMIPTNSTSPSSLFVSPMGEIYVDNGNAYQRVDVWRENATNYSSTSNTGGTCFSLFVVTNDSMYCSLAYQNQVIKDRKSVV